MKQMELGCSELRALLPGYIFEESTAEEADAVGRHLSRCASCREQEVYLRTMVRAVRRRDRAQARRLRRRRRAQATAWGSLALVALAALLYWMDARTGRSADRAAEIAAELRSLNQRVDQLGGSAGAVSTGTTVVATAAPPPSERIVVSAPEPPPPPTASPAERLPGAELPPPILESVGPIRLLEIGETGSGEGPEIGPAQEPYTYHQLRSLILAGVSPESRRVDPETLMAQFSPVYRSDADTPLVVSLAAAPSPFASGALLMSVGLGHQPTSDAVEPPPTDYVFVLAESGNGAYQRVVRNAMLPWLYDKLDSNSRVSVVTAGAEATPLLEQPLVQLPGGAQSTAAKLNVSTAPALYEAIRLQQRQLRESTSDRRRHVIAIATADTALPGPESAPWPDRLDVADDTRLDVTVVIMAGSADEAVLGRPYLDELVRQADGRLVQVGTDVIGWEQLLLPRIEAYSADALHGIVTELSFNPELVSGFRALHRQADWADTRVGAGDRWPMISRLPRNENRTGLYLLQPRTGGRPDRVAECRVRFDAGDAKFAAEERRRLNPNQIHPDFFTAPAQIQVPAVAAELSAVLLAPPGPDRVARAAKLKQVWNRLAPTITEAQPATSELGTLITALR